jgi:aminoglycoside phosphotransferase (APT) family kinase protein
MNIPTLEEYVKIYSEETNTEKIEKFYFYVAFSFFRLAGITQGILFSAYINRSIQKRITW